MASPGSDLDQLVEQVTAALRGRGDRMTRPRRAVLAVLAAHGDHLTSDAIVAAVAAGDPEVHRASVYRALETLTELGVARHVHVGHGRTAYHLTSRTAVDVQDPPHLHAHCSTCGALLDLPPDLLDDVAGRLLSEHGYVLNPTHVALSGTCVRCAT